MIFLMNFTAHNIRKGNATMFYFENRTALLGDAAVKIPTVMRKDSQHQSTVIIETKTKEEAALIIFALNNPATVAVALDEVEIDFNLD